MTEDTQTVAVVLPPDIDERRGSTSASNAHADSLCPGRHLAQRNKPEIPNPDSDFGTAVHLALATQDPAKLDNSQLKIYDQCNEIVASVSEMFFGIELSSVKRFIEHRFWCMPTPTTEHSAKPDLVLRSPTKALVIEFKALPGEIDDVSRNKQVRDQVVLVARTLLVKEVGAVLVRPLVTMSPDIVQYNEEFINIAEREMFARVEASNDPNSERKAGLDQCKFCRARVDCPEYLKMVAAAVPTKPMHEMAITVVANWTPEQRAQFLLQRPIATKWIDEVYRQLKRIMKEDPNSIPGWELEPGSIKRPVTDIKTLHDRFIALGGTTDDFLACAEIGKGDFEAKVRAVTNLKGKKLNQTIQTLLDGVTTDKQDDASLSKVKSK